MVKKKVIRKYCYESIKNNKYNSCMAGRVRNGCTLLLFNGKRQYSIHIERCRFEMLMPI